MKLVAGVAGGGPWRTAVEQLACVLGRKYPSNWVVRSFCRHFAGVLVRREGETFRRIVVFESGGRMLCGGEEKLAPSSLMYYFLGTITDQDEDERSVVKLLSRAVRRGDVFFDIGANLGFYSWFVGPLCGKTGAVHAFEASPVLRRHLERSAELNEATANIIVNAVAVGKNGNQTLELYDPDRIGGSSVYRLEWLNVKSSVTVPVTTIDDYRRATGIKRLDIVKIDIEGAELDAFTGMRETFEECPPWLIVCELILVGWEEREAVGHALPGSRGGHPREVIELLRARGYEPRYIHDNDGRLGRVVEEEALRRLPQNLINVAFVRPETRKVRPELFHT
jgi:FkbM family methyltransferase